MDTNNNKVELTGSDKYATSDPSKARYASDIVSKEGAEILKRKAAGDKSCKYKTTSMYKARYISDLVR